MDVKSLRQIGPYVVQRFVDRGAFAWVFEVADPKFEGRRLALKMLMPEAAEGEEFRRFESEARLLAQIDHPSVVTIFDFGRDEVSGNFYYVMTFVDGPTLKERLKQGRMSAYEALPIFIDLLDGLARLHEKGIVHRDIKPANVLLGRDGRARVADLGIARVQAERSQTRTGVAVGTALYMSPEQARGRAVDHRSDLFSLGLTLYECLTGKVIYDHVDSVDSSSGMDVLMYIGSLVHTRREFEVRFDADDPVSSEVQGIILKTLRLNPDDRFQSAGEMREALRAAMLGRPAAEAPARAASWPPPRLLLGAGGALSLLLIAAGVWFFYWSPLQQSQQLRGEASGHLEATQALGERGVAVASAVKDLSPAPPQALLEEVDDHLDRADRYLVDATADLADGSSELSIRNFERAREQSLAACQTLLDQVLSARASRSAERLRKRAIALSDLGAQEVVPAAWKALADALPPTEAPKLAAGGCEGAEILLAQLAAAAVAMPLAEAVEQQMTEAWPKRIAEAYENAVTARMVAVAVPSHALEYKVALKEAKRFLLEGSRHREDDDFRSARNAYRSAQQGFALAAAIAPASLAQREVKELAELAIAEVGPELKGAGALISAGDEAYKASRWERSTDLYKQATVKLKELRAANEWRRAAVLAQSDAMGARDEAMRQGGDKSAPVEFSQAEVSLTGAERALESGDARQAELRFADARDDFGAATRRAIQALRDAEMERASVAVVVEKLVTGDDCVALDSSEARSLCETGRGLLAAGSRALEELDAPTSLRNFRSSHESFARAASAQSLWEVARPRPPALVRRVPQRALVKVSPRQLNSFAVEASDPNGDLLHYTWAIGGQLQTEQGPTMKRRLELGSVVTVKVDDGKGGELLEQWQVEVVDRSAAGDEVD